MSLCVLGCVCLGVGVCCEKSAVCVCMCVCVSVCGNACVLMCVMHLSSADNTSPSTAVLLVARDAWIPTEQTRATLVSMVTSSPGTYFPDPAQMTLPGVIIDEPQVRVFPDPKLLSVATGTCVPGPGC